MEAASSCDASDASLEMVDSSTGATAALHLKLIGIMLIFVASTAGVALPLVGRGSRYLSTNGNVFFVARAFAAGVILATGFVHILPDGVAALRNPCLPALWRRFPFGAFVAMMSVLGTLLVDNLCTDYYESLHQQQLSSPSRSGREESESQSQPLIKSPSTIGRQDRQFRRQKSLLLRFGSQGPDGPLPRAKITELLEDGTNHEPLNEIAVSGEYHLSQSDRDHIRNTVILQVLEVAVISHSFIIGLSLGLSGSAHSVRPLITALCFHQFFEGFALGGSICQVDFKCFSATLKAGLFAVTTPLGIIVGICIASSYNADTPQALVVEGIFDSISAGILIYMALVALIAPDFRCDRIRADRQLQLFSYLALFSGALAMSALAFWA